MKHKNLLWIAMAVLFVLLYTLPVRANPCTGRQNCVGKICTDCGQALGV